MQIDSRVFLLLQGETPHYVYGKVIQVREKPSGAPIYVATFEGEDLGEPGDAVRLYYQLDAAFWCQRAKITNMEISTQGLIVTFEVTAKPRKEELRRAGRIAAHLSGITAAVQGKPECIVINVGEKGIAIVSNENHNIGDFVNVEVRWNAETWIGRMTIKHAKEAVRESCIYGLECSEANDGQMLREGLGRITATVTFQQGVLEEMLNGQLSA